MTTKEIRDALHAHPFRPFVVKTTSRDEHFVPHPEFVALSAGGRTIALYSQPDDAFVVLDLLLVEAIDFRSPGKRRRSA